MSIQALTWVIEHSHATLGARCMLVAIANHADEQGRDCWASVATLSHEARMSERGGRAALRRLERDNLILATGKSHRGTTIYRILGMGAEVSSPGSSRRQGGKLTTGSVSRTSPEPSLNRPKNHPSHKRVSRRSRDPIEVDA